MRDEHYSGRTRDVLTLLTHAIQSKATVFEVSYQDSLGRVTVRYEWAQLKELEQ